MAVERYLMIVHSKRFTYQQVTLILISLWISGSAFAALTFIGQIYFVVQSSGVYCLGDLRGTTVFHRLYSIGCVAVIFGTEVFTATSYYMIYRTALKDGFKWSDQLKSVDLKSGNSSVPRGSIVAGMNPNRASVASTPSATLTTSRKAYEKQLRLTKKLATITFIFFACWFGTLCSFTYQIATSEFVPPMVDFLLTMCPNLNSILNPLIVMTLDERWKVNWRFPWSLKKPAEGEA
ncbi:hypothetical protein BKA69DRAFT_1099192 [Paraphysoderma sedebokerense]|nr:hypothetical protein BKA69DRAFT_1099192 [Paraphysoderma sedebokerense]